MRRRIGLGFAGLFLFSVTLVHAQPPTVHAQEPWAHSLDPLAHSQNPFDAIQQFSASVSGGPLKWDKMKVYRSGKQMRAEYVYENEVRLSNLTDKNGWFIRPREWVTKPKQCGRMTLMDASSYPFFSYNGNDFSVERATTIEGSPAVANETIDGHSCKVVDYTAKPKAGAGTIKIKLWEAEDLKGFPVKIEIQPFSKPGFTISYTDVSLDRPNPKLFQLPALCHAGIHGKAKPPASAPKTPSKESPQPQK